MRYVFDSSDPEAEPDPSGVKYDLYGGGADARPTGPRFRVRVEVGRLDPLVIFDRRMDDASCERTLERLQRDGFSHFALQLVVSGHMRIERTDETSEAGPGEIALFDLQRPHRTFAQDARILTFAVPRSLVERTTIYTASLHGAILNSPASGLLADIMMSIVDRRLDEAPTEPAGVVRVFETALALALRSQAPAPGRPGDQPNMMDRVRQVVETHLARRDLTPALVAKLAGVSRSQLYAAFKPSGGVSRYIQERRVMRLRSLIQHPDHQSASIGQLAFQAGFASGSHANRSFSDVYGTTPGRLRLASSEPQPDGTGQSLQAGLHQWLSGLT